VANKLLPFRQGTRQRIQNVGTAAYAANSTVTLEFPRVGYLSRIVVRFAGTGTLSGAGALADLGPWSLVSRFRLATNIGAATVVDVSGYGAYLAQRLQKEGQDFGLGGIGSAAAHADVHSFPVAMGANVWNLSWILPVSANDGKEFEYGLINLQSPQTRVTLDIVTGALTDAATLVTGITGTFSVAYEYYEVPDPSRFAQPPLALCRLLEEQQPIGQTGDNIYTIPRQGVLMQAIQAVRLNGVRSDSFDTIALRFNKTDTVYRIDRQVERIVSRAAQELNPVTGIATLDLWRAAHAVGMGDARDNVDTEEMSTVELITTVSAGAGLGANNNFLQVIRRIAQRLEA
jgi:hypothetical protein